MSAWAGIPLALETDYPSGYSNPSRSGDRTAGGVLIGFGIVAAVWQGFIIANAVHREFQLTVPDDESTGTASP